jgi:23S rRNA pseudouridine2605 synthase
VGRLDRETTGLLLFTNDGDMAKKLTHPRYQARKIYHVELNKPFKIEDFDKILKGVDLEDGRSKADKISYIEGGNSKEVGIEIHSGKNRIVRRMFEGLGYVVVKLDRVEFASLTKKDLPRGMFRHLTENEVSYLKMTKNI